jgi:hypothetical protein
MRNATVRVAVLATPQSGVISRAQLTRCGVSDASISRWIAVGRLIRIHPGVYAVGHANLSIEGRQDGRAPLRRRRRRPQPRGRSVVVATDRQPTRHDRRDDPRVAALQ